MSFPIFNTVARNPYKTALAKKGRPLFIPFTVLGDPDQGRSLAIIETLIGSGADALELGLPFSDPPADGPVIQAADMRALAAGIRMDDCFEILKEVRKRNELPIGLLVYFNLVLQRGVEQFYADCASVGVDSVLIADLPLEHAEEVLPAAKAKDIAPVFLVSELTTEERLKNIVSCAAGYLYIASHLGVTGITDAILKENIRSVITRARAHTDLPLFAGFGIGTPAQARAASRAGADGVIVGSRIVQEVPNMGAMRKISASFASALAQ